jgi:hypothetical protein
MKKYHYFTALIILFAASTQTLSAYNPVNQTATTLHDRLAVFSIETSINPSRTGMTVPVFGSLEDSEHTFTYTLFSDTSTVAVGAATAFIVADAPIVDGYYQLPQNRNTQLQIVIVAVPRDDAERQQLRARIDALPLGSVVGLNPSELSNYQTPKTTI